jgi:hypothetical protein
MRNSQNITITGQNRRRRRRDHLVFVGRCRWLYLMAAGAGYSFLIYGSNTLFFFLYTWPFFLALMPVAVVVGIALHSLLKASCC